MALSKRNFLIIISLISPKHVWVHSEAVVRANLLSIWKMMLTIYTHCYIIKRVIALILVTVACVL